METEVAIMMAEKYLVLADQKLDNPTVEKLISAAVNEMMDELNRKLKEFSPAARVITDEFERLIKILASAPVPDLTPEKESQK